MSVSPKQWARNIPKDLQARRQWVAWGPDPDSGRPKCPLILSARDRRASTRKPDTWRDYGLALGVYERYADQDHGVGYVFTEKDGLVYIDIDDAIDPESRKAREWCREFIRPFIGVAYMETSPSGKGLHILTRGKLPEGAGCGGKVNFPEHATGERIPEVAFFASGKYTTITGDIWNKQGTIGDGQAAIEAVWTAAGILSLGADVAAGPAPSRDHLPKVNQKRVPKEVREELAACSAADAPDRSAARFRLYAAAAVRMDPEEVYALVVESDWYVASGASEKGEHATWADICRVCAKVGMERQLENAFEEREEREDEKAAASWKELGIPVLAKANKDSVSYEAVMGVTAIARYLTRHPKWAGRIWRDSFSQVVRLDDKVLGEHVAEIAEDARVFLKWDREPHLELVRMAIQQTADHHARNPVEVWLRGLKWDGKSRANDWLVRAGCSPDDGVAKLVGRKWLIGLVARALRPGCKMDNVLILEGAEGMKKSMLFETLVGKDLFSDSPAAFSRDDLLIMHRVWIVELAELSAFKKAEQESIKKFLAANKDGFRAPYARETAVYPRHFVCVGTTNDDEYLEAAATNRRYWPVRAEQLRPEIIAEEREQLLAEAVAAFDAGEPWWFDESEDSTNATPEELREARALREITDALMPRVQAVCDANEDKTLSAGEFMDLLGLDATRRDLQMRVAACLRKLGWTHKRGRRPGTKAMHLWFKPVERDGKLLFLG